MASPLLRTEQSAAPSFISLLSPAHSYEEYFHIDPKSPETRWWLIVLYIFMSGELFHIRLKMKINSFSGLCGELGTHLHFLLSLIHLHMLILCVSLPKSNWTLCFLFTLADAV